jgi:hypothetical protein
MIPGTMKPARPAILRIPSRAASLSIRISAIGRDCHCWVHFPQ